MGRKLAGPVKLPNSGENWFARLTVKPAQRPLVGRTRLIRSLETPDYTLALRRWPAAYAALEQELQRLLAGGVEVSKERRREIRKQVQGFMAPGSREVFTPDGSEELLPIEAAEIITGQGLDSSGNAPPLLNEVFTALTTSAPLSHDWQELIDLHASCAEQRKGESLSASWFKQVRLAVDAAEKVVPHPDLLTPTACREILKAFKEGGLTAKTISVKMSLLQAIVQTGIYEGCLKLQTNPFHTVRFAAATSEQNKYLPFDFQTQLPLLLNHSRYGWIYELLCTTGLRSGELLSRGKKHIQGRMLVIGRTADWKPKTKSSYRRVPLPAHLIDPLQELLPISAPRGMEQRLLKEVKQLFDHPQLVTHSCRHTFKSMSRKVGMPTDISDEIDGHKKKDVSAISDHYGSYPDDVLTKWIDVMSDEIQTYK